MDSSLNITVAIPTYEREEVLIETCHYLFELKGVDSAEIIIVDQTRDHTKLVEQQLESWHVQGRIKWLREERPSITHAMNRALIEASHDIVLFLDDDIIPDQNLLIEHLRAHEAGTAKIVSGQVLQPGECPLDNTDLDYEGERFLFRSSKSQNISYFMAGNVSMNTEIAISVGGFDENFINVAYNFEREMAYRLQRDGHAIWFHAMASIQHLRSARGGTRHYGSHLTTIRPSHAVGRYYYLFRTKALFDAMHLSVSAIFRSVRTLHHLRKPWYIPGTLIAESLGFLWSLKLHFRGSRHITAAHDLHACPAHNSKTKE